MFQLDMGPVRQWIRFGACPCKSGTYRVSVGTTLIDMRGLTSGVFPPPSS